MSTTLPVISWLGKIRVCHRRLALLLHAAAASLFYSLLLHAAAASLFYSSTALTHHTVHLLRPASAGHIFADSRGGAAHELNYQPTGRGLNSGFGKLHDYTCCYQTGAYRTQLAFLISLRLSPNNDFALLGGMTPLQVSFSAFYFCFLIAHPTLHSSLHSVLYIRTNQQ